MAKPAHTPPRTPNSSSLEDAIESLTQKFLETIASREKGHRRNPKETEKLLETFYRPGRTDGLIAQTRQKILVVKTKGADDAILENGDLVKVHYGDSGGSSLDASIKRISEYPNATDEFGVPTLTLLIEWKNTTNPDFIKGVKKLVKGSHDVKVMDQTDQTDNFIINPRPPNSEPDPPIQSLVLGSGILSLPVAKSDFSPTAYAIIDGQHEDFPDTTIKVVVSDTGLKFRLHIKPPQTYKTWNGLSTHFPIAPNPNRNATPPDPNRIGFCSLTNYLDDTYPLPPRDVSFPGGIPQDDRKVLRNPHDDHDGRHGTTIAAIVAQNPAGASAIIPLKIFDFLGFGTLFDILCGFNYIFARIDAGENIRIVNASWGAAVPGSDFAVYKLLEKKIASLQIKNVFVLASAGNRDSINDVIGHDLAVNRMVPACYSSSYKNVITVTTVAERWKKCLFNRRSRSHYLNKELHDRLLATGSFFERLLNLISNIIPDGYRAVENYSPHYVGVGVVAHPMRGFFPTPFAGALQLPIAGSSFATAFMSAYVVRFLRDNPEATRTQILASLPTHSSLDSRVEQGRYLELSTVTGATVEANFESVLRAILSAIS